MARAVRTRAIFFLAAVVVCSFLQLSRVFVTAWHLGRFQHQKYVIYVMPGLFIREQTQVPMMKQWWNDAITEFVVFYDMKVYPGPNFLSFEVASTVLWPGWPCKRSKPTEMLGHMHLKGCPPMDGWFGLALKTRHSYITCFNSNMFYVFWLKTQSRSKTKSWLDMLHVRVRNEKTIQDMQQLLCKRAKMPLA